MLKHICMLWFVTGTKLILLVSLWLVLGTLAKWRICLHWYSIVKSLAMRDWDISIILENIPTPFTEPRQLNHTPPHQTTSVTNTHDCSTLHTVQETCRQIKEKSYISCTQWYAEYFLRLHESGQVAACLSHTRKTDKLNTTDEYAGKIEESELVEVRA